MTEGQGTGDCVSDRGAVAKVLYAGVLAAVGYGIAFSGCVTALDSAAVPAGAAGLSHPWIHMASDRRTKALQIDLNLIQASSFLNYNPFGSFRGITMFHVSVASIKLLHPLEVAKKA